MALRQFVYSKGHADATEAVRLRRWMAAPAAAAPIPPRPPHARRVTFAWNVPICLRRPPPVHVPSARLRRSALRSPFGGGSLPVCALLHSPTLPLLCTPGN